MKVSHRITRLVLIALAVLALAAPAASAVPASAPTRSPPTASSSSRPSCRAWTTGSTGRRPRSAPASPAGSSCSSDGAASPTATATSTSASRTSAAPARRPRGRLAPGGRAGEHASPDPHLVEQREEQEVGLDVPRALRDEHGGAAIGERHGRRRGRRRAGRRRPRRPAPPVARAARDRCGGPARDRRDARCSRAVAAREVRLDEVRRRQVVGAPLRSGPWWPASPGRTRRRR